MKDLYLMRHGQTFFNQEGLVQGACDSPLTELGQDQAWQAGAYLQGRGIRFGQLYSSTQERASDTLNLSPAGPTILASRALKNGTLVFLRLSPNACNRSFDQEPPLLKTSSFPMEEKVWTKSVSACWLL